MVCSSGTPFGSSSRAVRWRVARRAAAATLPFGGCAVFQHHCSWLCERAAARRGALVSCSTWTRRGRGVRTRRGRGGCELPPACIPQLGVRNVCARVCVCFEPECAPSRAPAHCTPACSWQRVRKPGCVASVQRCLGLWLLPSGTRLAPPSVQRQCFVPPLCPGAHRPAGHVCWSCACVCLFPQTRVHVVHDCLFLRCAHTLCRQRQLLGVLRARLVHP